MTDERWQVLRETTWFRAEQDEVTAYVEDLRRQQQAARALWRAECLEAAAELRAGNAQELLQAAARIREAGGIEPVRLGEGHLDPRERSNKDPNE